MGNEVSLHSRCLNIKKGLNEDSNLIPLGYEPNALTTTPFSLDSSNDCVGGFFIAATWLFPAGGGFLVATPWHFPAAGGFLSLPPGLPSWGGLFAWLTFPLTSVVTRLD